jgi:ABC-type Fe3+-siderophore transport system permease subunit
VKKTFMLVALIVAPTLASAQGTVVFQNAGTGLVMQWTSDRPDNSLVPVTKGNAMVQLITAPQGTPMPHPFFYYTSGGGYWHWFPSLEAFLTANPGWTAQAVGGVNSADGLFDNGTISLMGIAGGAPADCGVIGWTGTYPTLDAAIAAGAWLGGSAATFTTATGDPSASPAVPPVSLGSTFKGMILAPYIPETPEPSISALAVGSAVMLLLFRRRG